MTRQYLKLGVMSCVSVDKAGVSYKTTLLEEPIRCLDPDSQYGVVAEYERTLQTRVNLAIGTLAYKLERKDLAKKARKEKEDSASGEESDNSEGKAAPPTARMKRRAKDLAKKNAAIEAKTKSTSEHSKEEGEKKRSRTHSKEERSKPKGRAPETVLTQEQRAKFRPHTEYKGCYGVIAHNGCFFSGKR